MDIASLKLRMIGNREPSLTRKALERLDLLLLTIESLDLNGSQSLLWTTKDLGLDSQIPNRVELWKRRCLNPLRRTTRRGIMNYLDSEALILIVGSMSDRLYPMLRQLLSTREPESVNKERWDLLNSRFKELINERMNTRRVSVNKLLQSNSITLVCKELIFTLALSSGPGGVDRLRASLMDHSV